MLPLKAREAINNALQELETSSAKKITIARFISPKRMLFIKRKARFETVAEGWALGVLLLDTEGSLFCAGETTRSAPPGHGGHTSGERERRRGYIRAAHESGYPTGQVIYFDSPKIDTEQEELNANLSAELSTRLSPLTIENGEAQVRWNKANPKTTVPLDKYLQEQLSLRL